MGKGGSQPDQSGEQAAMASAQAADQAYALGEQQLQWTEQVWNQEQPLVDQSEQEQISLEQQQQESMAQATAESQQQYAQYEDLYAPLEAQYTGQAENWASPEAMAEARGQAMGDVAEQGQAGLNAAAEQLRSYGINPSSPRYASLYTSAQPMLSAAEAAAGTTTSQNLRMQQMGLEAGAINTGRGLVNASQGLTEAGTGAGSAGEQAAEGAAGTAQSNLSTGSTAMTAPTAWFNAGANNMSVYTGAVNGYNQAQAESEQAQAGEMGGLGSALGGILGLAKLSDSSEKTDIKRVGTHSMGIPLYAFRYKDDPKSYPKVVGPMAEDVAKVKPGAVSFIPGSGGKRALNFAGGGMVDPTRTPTQGGGPTGIPSAPMMPGFAMGGFAAGGVGSDPGGQADATPGGGVPAHASPSMGAATDDVPAMLTANEFVIPKDVATWKGHEYFAKQIDQARQGQQAFSQRQDVGGEPTNAPAQQPTFVSRPAHAMGGPISGGNVGAIPMLRRYGT